MTKSTPSVPRADADQLNAAVEAVRAQTDRQPRIALVLGSGLGELADAAEDATVIPADAIPHYPQSTVAGHHGRLVLGTLKGTEVVFVQGRVHYYEGHPVQALAFPVRLVHALGARRLLVTNAAGGINPGFTPGTLMFIRDHINYAFASSVVGGTPPFRALRDGGEVRGHAPYYDAAWMDEAEAIARDLNIEMRRGVYLWTKGPSYETKAEVRAFEQMGADAVGMSTVPEVIQAQRLGMRVLGISTITNPAAGVGSEPLDHDDVLEVGARVRDRLAALVEGIVADL